MIATLSVMALLAGCLGCGAAILRAADVSAYLHPAELLGWAFALGFGFLGWIMFPIGLMGLISPSVVGGWCVLMLPGLLFLKRDARDGLIKLDAWTLALLGAIAAACAGDLIEGLAPPGDADSLAYHFAIPKQFLEAGRIEFIPRASDGAAPLLVQMTYLAVLTLGGERAMTLWCMVTGWAASFLVYGVGRRYLSVNWALLVALIVLTVPAVLYGAGTGQVEARLMLFTVVAAFAVADAIHSDGLRFSVIAGIAAGFMMASKFPGLIYALACGCVLLLQKRWLRHGLVFSAGAILAGVHWYIWNWWNTGDPVFPLLFGIVPYLPGVPWNAEQHLFMQQDFFGGEVVLPRTFFSLIMYPFLVSLWPDPVFESGRVGFGPYPLLLLPFVVAALYRQGIRAVRHTLFLVILIAAVFYVVWFFIGPSQRVRHLLPILPLILIAGTAASEWVTRTQGARLALVAAAAATTLIQLSGQAVAATKFTPFVLGQQSREDFLSANVGYYDAARWINENLRLSDRVLVTLRQLVYFIDIPVFYAHRDVEARVETRSTQKSVELFWSQLRQQHITHIVVDYDVVSLPSQENGGLGLSGVLVARHCAEIIALVSVNGDIRSRTLPTLGSATAAGTTTTSILRLKPSECQL